MPKPGQTQLRWLAILLWAAFINGCGGGSSTKGQPDFSLSTSLAVLSITAGGGAQPVTLTATGVNGSAGVTASPATLNLIPSTPHV